MNIIEAIDSRLAEIDDERMRLEATRSRLIAELLEACERVIDSIEGGATTPEESITYVRAAIAKAKGENHDE